MNWISNVVRPRIRGLLTTKREVPDNMWIKCPETGQMVFYKDLEANQFVVPGSNFHIRMAADIRLKHLFDNASFEKISAPTVSSDPLKFRDGRRYIDRLRDARADTSLEDAVLVGAGKLDTQPIVAAVQDFRFMGGSLGMAAGETIIAGMMHAVKIKTPFILFTASGGARMQEGILSLMQMPRTTIAVQKLRDNKLPYIVVLTDPTTGGVTASYAMLGDVHIAEPGALICFAGPRVIQQTIREELPKGFQRAEYLLEHGMLDMVVHRHHLRDTLSKLVNLFTVRISENVNAVSYRTSKVSPLSPEKTDTISEEREQITEDIPEAQSVNGVSSTENTSCFNNSKFSNKKKYQLTLSKSDNVSEKNTIQNHDDYDKSVQSQSRLDDSV
ncbi:MAG: Acetyl-coenzyme A carboxylase carboxyl transferase subunit beta, chloroplastic [Hyphomicrobiaceae bacterium hypho_1]